MTERPSDLLNPFRLYDNPTMYQPLPNVKRDGERVKPARAPKPAKTHPKKKRGGKKKPTKK
jgi:hypothetical protein